jgi:DNA (cytosine-5)-methyltransferase 1
LCGSMFGLRSTSGLCVERHRYFELGYWPTPPWSPNPCAHTRGRTRTMSIVGNGTPTSSRRALGRGVTVAEWREGMGMPWASRFGLSEAIPPAYTEWIGAQLLGHLRRDARAG